MEARLRQALERAEEVARELGDPETTRNPTKLKELGREHVRLDAIRQAHARLERAQQELAQAREVLHDRDPELSQLARADLERLQPEIERLERQLAELLAPADPLDDRDAIVEIRAGTGGDEAALFAADLFRMYTRFCERRGWKVEVLSLSEGTLGGLKEAIFAARGPKAYGILRYESGVHRVQRVRVTHLPTGLVVQCQDQKSQLQNKIKALEILRSRLLDRMVAEQEAARARERRAQVGTGDRSQKVRTYNFPQNRVTDHRIHFTAHNIDEVMDGRLDELIAALKTAQEKERLSA